MRLPTRSRIPLPLVTQAGAVAASFMMVIAASRSLAPSVAGQFFTLFAVSVAAATAGRFGTDTESMKAGAAGALSTATFRRLAVICTSRALVVALAVPAVAIVAVVDEVGHLETLSMYVAVVCATFFAAVSVFFGATLRGLHQISRGIIIETGLAPAVAALLMATWAHSLATVLWAFAIGNVVAAALGLACVQRVDLRSAREHQVMGRSAELSRMAMGATATMFYLLTWAPVLALGFGGYHLEAAYFSVAARIANFINLVPAIQNSYITPRIARAHAEHQSTQVNRIAVGAARLALLVALPLAAVFTTSSMALEIAFGEEYAAAVPAMRILVIGATLTLAIGPVNAVMLTTGREALSTALNFTLLSLTVLAVIIAAAISGVTAVALVTSVATVTYSACAAAFLHILDGRRTAAWSPLRTRSPLSA